MPSTADQEGQKQVAQGHENTAAAAPHGTNIVAQPTRQRHVPASPEILDRNSAIRRVKVEGQLNAKYQRHANRHIGVAGKIEIELKRIG